MSAGDLLLASLVDRAVEQIKGLPEDCRQSGDSDLETVWDEFKFQLQHEQSVYFWAYEDTIRRICAKLVQGLDRVDQARLWLMTEASEDPDRGAEIPYGDPLIEDVGEMLYQRVVSRAQSEEVHSGSYDMAQLDAHRDDWELSQLPLGDSGCKKAECVCDGEAHEAYESLRSGPIVHRFVSRSHFTVELRTCPECGKHVLKIWHEIVNFDGGDDDDTTCIAPVQAPEAEAAIRSGDWEALLGALDDDCRILMRIWPDRSETPGPRWEDSPGLMKALFGPGSPWI